MQMMRTPTSRVRGLGSAREGAGHWMAQRMTAIANVILVLWFLISAISLAGAGFEESRAWLASPISASLMILLVISAFYHARLGIQTVIEDYVRHDGIKIASLAALTLMTAGLAVACVVAILKISLGG